MTELILIRHGETDWNRQQRFQGQIDVPLNAAGQAQAARLAERLAGEAVDALVCSDLLRARQTAEPVARALGLPIITDADWREQSFGELEGLRVADIQQRFPQAWLRWIRHDADDAVPGGESTRHFHDRIVAAARRTASAHAGRRLLVVTHGGVLDMLWRASQSLSLHGARACAIPNCGINRMRCDDGGLHVVHWADDAHLGGLPVQPSTVPASVTA